MFYSCIPHVCHLSFPLLLYFFIQGLFILPIPLCVCVCGGGGGHDNLRTALIEWNALHIIMALGVWLAVYQSQCPI